MKAKSDAESTYRNRRRRRRFLWLASLAAAASVAVFAAWRPDLPDPCDPPTPASEAAISLLPPGLSLDGIATVTDVRRDELYIDVQAVASRPPSELAVQIQDAVVAAGYRPAGLEGDEFDAEVFFSTETHAAGQARVEPAACHGRWDVELVLLDRNAVPPAATAPTTIP